MKTVINFCYERDCGQLLMTCNLHFVQPIQYLQSVLRTFRIITTKHVPPLRQLAVCFSYAVQVSLWEGGVVVSFEGGFVVEPPPPPPDFEQHSVAHNHIVHTAHVIKICHTNHKFQDKHHQYAHKLSDSLC